MGMVFCRGCAKEIHESALTCPHCGAPQAVSAQPKVVAYTSYEEVPFYRKQWFFGLSIFIFLPVALLIIMTGETYRVYKGKLIGTSKWARIFLSLLFISLIGLGIVRSMKHDDDVARSVAASGSHEIKSNSLITVDSADLYQFERSPIRIMLINKDLYAMLDKDADATGDFIACSQIENANSFAGRDTSTAADELYQRIAADAIVKQAENVGFGCRMGNAEELTKQGTLTARAPIATAPRPPAPPEADAAPALPSPSAPAADAPAAISSPATQPTADVGPTEADVLSKYHVSFDCTKASTTSEKLICATPILGQLDGLSAATYRDRSVNPQFGADKAIMKSNQLNWIKERNTCDGAACLEKTYRQRISDLCDMPVINGVFPEGDCNIFMN